MIGGKGQLCPDGFEAYSHHHYLTLTGQRLPQASATVADCTATLAAIHLAVFGEEKSEPAAAARGPLPETFLDDVAVVEKAIHSKGGEKFQKLWNGNPSDYQSRSEADFALAGRLAFYCGPNPGQIERLMRQSGIVRPKWDRPHYLEKTIANVLKKQQTFYRSPCGYHADSLRCPDSNVQPETTVRGKEDKSNYPQGDGGLNANCWRLPERIKDKYASNPWDCPHAFGAAGVRDLSPALIAATCRKRNCPVCGAYWALQTFDRFGFHLSGHDGQLYVDTVPDVDWAATLKDMRRRARKLDVPLRFVTLRNKEGDELTVLASVPVRNVAHPVELAEALNILERAIDNADFARGPSLLAGRGAPWKKRSKSNGFPAVARPPLSRRLCGRGERTLTRSKSNGESSGPTKTECYRTKPGNLTSKPKRIFGMRAGCGTPKTPRRLTSSTCGPRSNGSESNRRRRRSISHTRRRCGGRLKTTWRRLTPGR